MEETRTGGSGKGWSRGDIVSNVDVEVEEEEMADDIVICIVL